MHRVMMLPQYPQHLGFCVQPTPQRYVNWHRIHVVRTVWYNAVTS